MKGMYHIYEKPVPLIKVTEGLWVTAKQEPEPLTEENYFRSVELFNKPMQKKKK